eukprot:TRINITY_DN2921_c0_g1_i12.p1 TRINITY_DN2921_c0_g1~~TRINITY_DN2921_c0_g1_i12.p1  ORF type:complete len:375 (+),score=60.64 TRINITY_DN2921_c0_g1_i12:108-1232(+)
MRRMHDDHYRNMRTRSTNIGSLSEMANRKQGRRTGSTEKILGKSRRSVKNIDKFISVNSNFSSKLFTDKKFFHRHFKLAKCLLIADKQKKYLLARAMNVLKFAIRPKSAVVYKVVHLVDDLSEVKLNNLKSKLCKGLNVLNGNKMGRMLEYLHLWRDYTYFVRRLDPDIFNSQSTSKPALVLESKAPMYSAQILQFSAALKILNKIANRRKQSAVSKLKAVAVSSTNIPFYKYYRALSVIAKHLSNSLSSYIHAWQQIPLHSNTQIDIEGRWKGIGRMIVYKLLGRGFYRWRYKVKAALSSEGDGNVEEEKITEVGAEIFQKEITKGEGEFNQLISRAKNVPGMHDVEMKVKIRSICQDMMKEIISRYLIYKEQ